MTEISSPLIQSSQFVQVMREVLERWKRNQPADFDWLKMFNSFGISDTTLKSRLETLFLINCFQWHLEDECRLNYNNLTRLGELKILIDESNSRRVKTVFNIDSEIVKTLYGNNYDIHGKRPIGESVGSIYDRLTVMYIKCHHLRESGDCGRNMPLNEQIKDTLVYLDEMLNELVSCKRVLKLYSNEKVYKAIVSED